MFGFVRFNIVCVGQLAFIQKINLSSFNFDCAISRIGLRTDSSLKSVGLKKMERDGYHYQPKQSSSEYLYQSLIVCCYIFWNISMLV